MKVQQYFFTAITIVSAIFSIQSSCRNGTATTAAAAVPDVKQNSLLWKIEGEGIKEPSYLYGTIHLIPAKDFRMGKELERAIAASEMIVMELDMDDLDQMALAKGSMLPDGMTLEDIFTEEEYARLSTYLRDSLNSGPMEMIIYKKMKPLLLSQVFVKQYLDEQPMSFELEFMKIAKEQNKAIEGLETIEQQLAFIDSIPLRKQADMVLQAMDEMEEAREGYFTMVRYYKEQKMDSLYIMMTEEYPDFVEYQDVFLENRNRQWIPAIEKYIRKGPSFIAVGAGHLLGEEGVVDLLRKKGYILTAVPQEH